MPSSRRSRRSTSAKKPQQNEEPQMEEDVNATIAIASSVTSADETAEDVPMTEGTKTSSHGDVAVTLETYDNSVFALHEQTITAMALNETIGKLMVAYASDSPSTESDEATNDVVEQWNVLVPECARRERIVRLETDGVSALCWVQDQFVVAAHKRGLISILSPHSTLLKLVQIAPSPLWSVAPVNDCSVLVGTHSGQLVHVSVPDGVTLRTQSLGVETRVFSLAVSPVTHVAAVGGVDYLALVHPLRRDKESLRTRLERSDGQLPTVVWSVCWISESVVAAADSRAIVSFWSADSLTQLSAVHAHQADVLSLGFDVADRRLFAAGVDPRIAVIAPTKESGAQWARVGWRPGHQRDVRALCVSGQALYSAGVDHGIRVSNHRNSRLLDVAHHDRLQVAGRFVAVHSRAHVDVWLRSYCQQQQGADDADPVVSEPRHLVRLVGPRIRVSRASEKKAGGGLKMVTVTEKARSKVHAPITATALSSSGLAVVASGNYVYVAAFDETNESKRVWSWESQDYISAVAAIDDASVLMISGQSLLQWNRQQEDPEELLSFDEHTGVLSNLRVCSKSKVATVLSSRCTVVAISLEDRQLHTLQTTGIPFDVVPIGDRVVVLERFADGHAELAAWALPGWRLVRRIPIQGENADAEAGVAVRVEPLTDGESGRARFLVVSSNGFVAIADLTLTDAISSFHPLDASCGQPLAVAVGKEATHVVGARFSVPPPRQPPFKLKKFGTL